MKLKQINTVDLQPIQGSLKLFLRILIGSFIGFRGQEKMIAMLLHPGAYAQFGLAVFGCRINMVDAVFPQDIQRPISFRLTDLT